RLRADIGVLPGPVINEERLPQAICQPRGYQATDNVLRATGWGAHKDVDRSRWIGLRQGDARHSRKSGSACRQAEKLSAVGTFHEFSPKINLKCELQLQIKN